MASKSIDKIPTTELFKVVVSYILNIWLSSNSFIDDVEEPRCLLALQNLAKRLNIDFKEWLDIIDSSYPEWFKEDIQLGQILKDINIDL